MELFKLLQKKSKYFYFYLLTLGLINSVWSGALLLVINNKIAGIPLPFLNEYDWSIYLTLIVVSFIFSRYFQSYMIKLTYELGNDMGLSIFDKLRFTNYEEYLKLGEDKVRTAMTDVTTLQRFPQTFIETFNAVVMAFMGVCYLFYTNTVGAGVISLVLALLGLLYYVRNIPVYRDLSEVRTLANIYQQDVNDFLKGFKEVKMSTLRSDTIFKKYITPNRNKVKNLTVKTLMRHMFNELIIHYVWYFLIGIILFMLPILISMSPQMNSSFLVTLLYLMGPVSIVVSEIREYTQMQIALERITDFNETIDASKFIEIGHGKLNSFDEPFKSIRFENVEFEYFDTKKQKTFRLKPLNITINQGESIFVTGGNGSGKSTFINLITGLYMPQKGQIFYNEKPVNTDNYPSFRNKLTSIFTDNFLFTNNYNNYNLNRNNTQLMLLIDKMGLTDAIAIDEKNNVIQTNLSKGQQKRLALIFSILEDKDVYVLDEWAAEQDPKFREYFYKKIIPNLKAMGKTIIAVTHDDAYFEYCERMIRFDYGAIQSDTYYKRYDEFIANSVLN